MPRPEMDSIYIAACAVVAELMRQGRKHGASWYECTELEGARVSVDERKAARDLVLLNGSFELIPFDTAGDPLGWFQLIPCNGADVIVDYAAHGFGDAVVAAVEQELGRP